MVGVAGHCSIMELLETVGGAGPTALLEQVRAISVAVAPRRLANRATWHVTDEQRAQSDERCANYSETRLRSRPDT